MIPKEMELIKDDVVISGIGGYFPESLNIEQFQKNLLENKNLVSTRWRQGCFVDNTEKLRLFK